MEKKLKVLFENLCCSHCKNSFDEESFKVQRTDMGLVVVKIECRHCGKSFGIALLGVMGLTIKEPLEIQQGPEPITYDDVIDAHKFIQNLDEHWQNYIQKDE